MTDANTQFFAILTNVGKAKQANADALGIPWKLSDMGVGDANNIDPVIPSEGQTRLINEWRRRPLNRLLVDPVNPAVLIAEQVIPADEGGRWIREIGLYDADGDLVAVANCAPSFKPLLSQGSGRTQIVRMNFIVTSTGNIQLKVDPAVVLATRAYVEAAILEVLPKNKTAGQYTRVKVNERGIVESGDNPTTLEGYGITDSYSKTQVDQKVSDALAATAPNRLLGLRRFRSAQGYTQIYNATPGTGKVRVRGEGAGGSGGGAYSTAAGQISGGCGGSAGAFFDTWITSGFNGVQVTLGRGGVGVLAAKGGNGGATSFGAFATAPGGYGGGLVANVTPPSYLGRTPNSETATGGFFSNGQGQSGGGLIGPGTGYVVSGEGGPGRLGAGGNSISQSGNGTPSGVPGAGGGGAVAQPSWPSNLKGGDGGDGWIEIEEWT
ncbi:phage tail protein [Pseudomonas sp. R16(2017)]|uniref:phage tail protein n=1 Tax=Pseudomonas sp. R16(2017) TaxID=1981704 RepID=UPI00211591DE|nr:phage tail protein [Pseudomonas sp. R16(2017)]